MFLCLCFKRKLLQQQNGSDWNVTVLFWLVLTRFRSCLCPIVWDAICLSLQSHKLAQSHQERHQVAFSFPVMVSFLLRFECITASKEWGTTWGISMKFSGKMSYDNIKGHKKTGFHPLFRRCIFWKNHRGSHYPPTPLPPLPPSP